MTHGRVIDRSAVLASKTTLLSVEGQDWAEHMQAFLPLRSVALLQLKRACEGAACAGPDLDLLIVTGGVQ